LWPGWRNPLIIVKPDTVVGWSRKGFRLFWTWKSRRGSSGRPAVPKDIRDLIRTMSLVNPFWGAPHVHGELLKLGIDVSQSTVAKYMVRHRKPPSQTWRTFLANHVHNLVSLDFFTVPTVTFRVLFVFIVLAHDRRRVIHFNVTEQPTAAWTAQQIVEAFPWDTVPRYLLRDRNGIYRDYFRRRVSGMGIDEVPSTHEAGGVEAPILFVLPLLPYARTRSCRCLAAFGGCADRRNRRPQAPLERPNGLFIKDKYSQSLPPALVASGLVTSAAPRPGRAHGRQPLGYSRWSGVVER
jgi:hypothetical protein